MGRAEGSGRLYYANLDLVRFACALVVVLYHLGFSSWFAPMSGGAKLVAGAYKISFGLAFWWGGIGVQIFFVISGFVIAASANGASALGFVRSRVERLYPAIWICGTISAAAWILSGVRSQGDMIGRYLREMLLWPKPTWVDGQLWTLVVEIGFYSIILLAILCRVTKWFPQIACAMIVVNIPFAFLSAGKAMGIVQENFMAQLLIGPQAVAAFKYGSYFGLGMLLWLKSCNAAPRWTVPFALLGFIACILMTGVAGLYALKIFGNALPWLTFAWPVPAGIFAISCMVIAYSKPVQINPNADLSLRFRITRSLGLATYPL